MLSVLNRFAKQIHISPGVIIISLVYLTIFLLMHPLYSKAWLDDFAYLQTAKHLVEDGYFKVSEWSSASLISQVIWASFFTKIFGFSLVNLQISTVVLFYFGLIAFYGILRELKVPYFNSLIFTFALLGFPWILLFAYSFMSDVPFLSFLLISMYFYLKGLNKSSQKALIIGSIFACCAFLTRQIGLLLPLSAAAAILLGKNKGKLNLLIAATLLPTVVFVSYGIWLGTGDNRPFGQYRTEKGLLINLRNLFPDDAKKIGITSRWYAEIIYRIGFYIANILGLVWPIFLIFLSRSSTKLFKKKTLHLSLIIFSIIWATFLFPPYSKILKDSFTGLFFPMEISHFTRDVWFNWLPAPRDFWDKTIIFTIPVLALFVSFTLQLVWQKLFYWKNKTKLKYVIVTILCSTILLTAHGFYQLSYFINYYTLKEVWVDLWPFYLILQLFVTIGIIAVYKIRMKPIRPELLFVFITFISIFSFTLVLPYMWSEYVIQFPPFIFIAFALLSKELKLNKTLAVAAVTLLVFVSFANAKILHTSHGLIWKTAEELVKTGVEPRSIQIYSYAWYPWWYYERDFKEAVLKIGGDKRDLPKLQTWEFTPLADQKYDVQFSKVPCPEDALVKNEVKTILIPGYACATKSP